MRYTIGRFAGLHQVSKKTLRYYKDIGLLEPAGIDPGNGYAYYEDEQRQRMRRIQYLRKLRFPLEEIRSMLPLDEEALLRRMRAQLTVIRAELRLLRGVERELLSLEDKLRQGKELFAPMETKERSEFDVFTLNEPIFIIGRGARVPYNKPEEKSPMIESLIDGFFGDGCPDVTPNRTLPHVQLGIVGEFDPETGMGLYMMGTQVASLDEIPQDMRSFTLNPGTYARLTFSAPDQFTLTTEALDKANGELFGTHIPASGYETAQMLCVEVYRDEKFELPSGPEMEVWAPVIRK